jgi:hypothetical protein
MSEERINRILSDVGRIRVQFSRAMKELGERFGIHLIPLTAVFEALGYSGVTGLEWGALVGIIVTLAEEAGYEIIKLGKLRYLRKKVKGSTGAPPPSSTANAC